MSWADLDPATVAVNQHNYYVLIDFPQDPAFQQVYALGAAQSPAIADIYQQYNN